MKKSFANYLLYHNSRENFCNSGNLIYKNSSQDYNVQENIHECFQIRKICELFLPQTILNIRYILLKTITVFHAAIVKHFHGSIVFQGL